MWNFVPLLALFVAPCLAVDPGSPLFLTPLIEKGEISKAQLLSLVPPFNEEEPVRSFSGFITVNASTNASMFFWFFPASLRTEAPLIVWLQGGPGSTSLFGQFVEMGPYQIDPKDNTSVILRKIAPWSYYYNLVFIDQPVGTGFSFTDDPDDYRTDQNGVADYLFKFISQFSQLFPTAVKEGLYVSGESYAGKYVPSFSHRVFKEMQQGTSPITLKGFMVGDGLSDPESVIITPISFLLFKNINHFQR